MARSVKLEILLLESVHFSKLLLANRLLISVHLAVVFLLQGSTKFKQFLHELRGWFLLLCDLLKLYHTLIELGYLKWIPPLKRGQEVRVERLATKASHCSKRTLDLAEIVAQEVNPNRLIAQS